MKITKTAFSNAIVTNYFDTSLALLKENFSEDQSVIISDSNIIKLYSNALVNRKVIIIEAGENNKTQAAADKIIEELLELDADKQFTIIGLGGGVVTDIAGYVSAIYKRGTKLSLVPTSVLAMTDAAIGGKNGVNFGKYKNMVGTTRQPECIFFDYSFLSTLPKQEWISGFAEIIKHACIKDDDLFEFLERHTLDDFMEDKVLMGQLIERNVAIKYAVVTHDELEKADRFLLNFGHTFGHAIENIYGLPHGYAVSLGMVAAAKISEEINNFHSADVKRISNLLEKYGLPVEMKTDPQAIFALMIKDKKRSGDAVNFVLLNRIGDAVAKKISFKQLQDMQNQIL
jgi:3-dehydroquinate synthase